MRRRQRRFRTCLISYIVIFICLKILVIIQIGQFIIYFESKKGHTHYIFGDFFAGKQFLEY